jgi:hypothetical protein
LATAVAGERVPNRRRLPALLVTKAPEIVALELKAA